MIHKGEHAEIRKRPGKHNWRIMVFDKWGFVCFCHHVESFEGARLFVVHLIHVRNEMEKLRGAKR